MRLPNRNLNRTRRGFTHIVAEPTRQLREELATIGLLAAQVMVAAVHVRNGEGLDPTDREVLERTADLFRNLVDRIKFIQSGGQGKAAETMLSAGATTDLVLPEQPPQSTDEMIT